MQPLVCRLELDQLDHDVATFTMPRNTLQVTVALDREQWEKDGRPSGLHVGVTTDQNGAMTWLRMGD